MRSVRSHCAILLDYYLEAMHTKPDLLAAPTLLPMLPINLLRPIARLLLYHCLPRSPTPSSDDASSIRDRRCQEPGSQKAIQPFLTTTLSSATIVTLARSISSRPATRQGRRVDQSPPPHAHAELLSCSSIRKGSRTLPSRHQRQRSKKRTRPPSFHRASVSRLFPRFPPTTGTMPFAMRTL